jgi:alkaline phosphatase
MGFESVKAASLYKTGQEEALSFQSFPHKARMTHNNARNSTTDSAAAATAIATGVRVNNTVVSVALPGDGEKLETLLERFQSEGKRTGLVTTSYIEDATPAAFAAHQRSRGLYRQVALDMLKTRPHLLMGAYRVITPEAAREFGYQTVETEEQLNAFDSNQDLPIAGLFGIGKLPYEFDDEDTGAPDLSEMTVKALDILDAETDGFFLMVENENIDESGHHNHIQRHVAATLELDEAVKEAVLWATGRTDTLILVTSDHETGGLKVKEHLGKDHFPEVTWSTKGHTETPVPLYAVGPRSKFFRGTVNNTDVFKILTAGTQRP